LALLALGLAVTLVQPAWLRASLERQHAIELAREVEDLLPKFLEGGHFARMPRRWSDAADAPVIEEEVRAAVREGIESLPENYRIALLLRDIEGLDNSELAEHLGVTVNAAKIRVHRARLALREVLDPHLAEGPE